MTVNVNTAFILVVTGILLVYCEFIWVGKVFFGVAGGIMALIGIASLSQSPHTTVGLILIAGAVVCFAIESAFQTFCLAGILATSLWAFGFWKLCPIRLQLVFPVSAVFGAATIWLLSIAKRARRNKFNPADAKPTECQAVYPDGRHIKNENKFSETHPDFRHRPE